MRPLLGASLRQGGDDPAAHPAAGGVADGLTEVGPGTGHRGQVAVGRAGRVGGRLDDPGVAIPDLGQGGDDPAAHPAAGGVADGLTEVGPGTGRQNLGRAVLVRMKDTRPAAHPRLPHGPLLDAGIAKSPDAVLKLNVAIAVWQL